MRGEPDFTISPVEWTEDGELVYSYGKAGVATRWLDTAGREHEAAKTPDHQQENSGRRSQGWPEDLGRIVKASYDTDTGDWLVTVSSVGESYWLYLYREGENPIRLVKGSKPAWRTPSAQK